LDVRVMFTSVPGVGHLHPMLPLAKALIAQGEELVWLTGPEGCERLRREGIVTHEAGPGEMEGIGECRRRFPEAQQLAPHELPAFMFPRLFGMVRAPEMLRAAVPVAKEWAPDVIVNDAAELAGPLIATLLGVPSVTHSFGALLPASRVAAAAEMMAPLWTEHGLHPKPFGGCYDHLYLDIYPPSLQSRDDAHLGAVQLVRPEGVATPGEPVPELVSGGASLPLLYVTLGTVFSTHALLSAVLDALDGMPVRVIVTVGPRGDPDALGPRPDSVHVSRYVAQQDLLPHCDAVISHAGSGTFLAALAAGLPQLCLPQSADQFLNAAAAEDARCGLALQPLDVSPRAIRSAVEQLLTDRGLRAAAERVRDEIASMPGPEQVARRVVSIA
jgi:UDP:flavonoid glycosyltransferase YjiC (YdhE family)